MQRLRELGVGLTIDDFGNGYSSLSRLAEFPIESLKIPKPFVDKLLGEDADEAFVDAILRLGDSLGLAAVVEVAFSLNGLGAYLVASRLRAAEGPIGETILFSVFATAAIVCAILMITNRNPVYSALWFALVTLNVCGLFWLQSAPFLAAATVIVYAGAIVVTFVFVIMLAQQSGSNVYDQQSRQPFLATLAAFLVLGALLSTLKASTSAGGTFGSSAPCMTRTGPLMFFASSGVGVESPP